MFTTGAALVIGATGGMGAAAARELARAGSAVALGYRTKADAADALAGELRTLGVAVSTHCLDVTMDLTVHEARDAAIAAHGRVHTLVWAAGPLVQQLPLAEVNSVLWRRALDVEVVGFFTAVQALLPHFREHGGGSIVHMGSAGALRWPERDGLSVAPKAANEAIVRGIAREEGRHGIRANSVLVGVIDAGMFHELSKAGAFDAAWEAETKKALAIKRWGRPEEIGHAVVFLASERANYVTGQQIAVAGGYGI